MNAGKFFVSSAVIVLEYCYHLPKPSGILVVSAFVDGVGNAELLVDFKSVSVPFFELGGFPERHGFYWLRAAKGAGSH